MKELNPIVMRKLEFEHRDISKLMSLFSNFQLSRFWRKEQDLRFFFRIVHSLSRRLSIENYIIIYLWQLRHKLLDFYFLIFSVYTKFSNFFLELAESFEVVQKRYWRTRYCSKNNHFEKPSCKKNFENRKKFCSTKKFLEEVDKKAREFRKSLVLVRFESVKPLT